MAIDLILVRHGRTEWNVGSSNGEHFRGQIDLPLNVAGMAQAEAVADRLANEPVVAVYSSPLKRARSTAEPIAARHGLAVQPMEGLIDINFGRWGGKSPAEVAAQWPDLYRRWLEEPHTVTFPDGERLAVVRRRLEQALEEVLSQHTEGVIVWVGHQVVNRVLICHLLGLDERHFWRIQQDTACVNRFRFDGDLPTILLLNDTCHLKGQV